MSMSICLHAAKFLCHVQCHLAYLTYQLFQEQFTYNFNMQFYEFCLRVHSYVTTSLINTNNPTKFPHVPL